MLSVSRQRLGSESVDVKSNTVKYSIPQPYNYKLALAKGIPSGFGDAFDLVQIFGAVTQGARRA